MGAVGNITCVHYWKIVETGRYMSLGRCSKCGAEKQFQEFIDNSEQKIREAKEAGVIPKDPEFMKGQPLW